MNQFVIQLKIIYILHNKTTELYLQLYTILNNQKVKILFPCQSVRNNKTVIKTDTTQSLLPLISWYGFLWCERGSNLRVVEGSTARGHGCKVVTTRSATSRAGEPANSLAAPALAPDFFFKWLRLRPLILFPIGSSSKGPKKLAPAPDYWLSLAKYSFPHKLVR